MATIVTFYGRGPGLFRLDHRHDHDLRHVVPVGASAVAAVPE